MLKLWRLLQRVSVYKETIISDVHCASLYACTVDNTHATQVMLCRHSTDNVCTTPVSTLNQSCNFS